MTSNIHTRLTSVRPVFDRILGEVTDELQHRVLNVMLENVGLTVTRRVLVAMVFHAWPEKAHLAEDTRDRKCRIAIEQLRREGWPILSISGQAGYMLSYDELEIARCADSLSRQAETLRETARVAYTWMRKARMIAEEMRGGQQATQLELMG